MIKLIKARDPLHRQHKQIALILIFLTVAQFIHFPSHIIRLTIFPSHVAEHVFDTVPISATHNLNLQELLLSVNVATETLNPLSQKDVSPHAVALETSSDHWTVIIHVWVLRVGQTIVGGAVSGKSKMSLME